MNTQELLDARQAAYLSGNKSEVQRLNVEILNRSETKVRTIDEIFADAMAKKLKRKSK